MMNLRKFILLFILLAVWFACLLFPFFGKFVVLGEINNQTEFPIIQLLVAYTPAVRGESCSIGVTHTRIFQAVQEINQSFKNSNINASLVLVGVVEIAYTESGNLGGDLQVLQEGTGSFNMLHDLRDQLGADLVSLIVEGEASCSDGYASFTIVDGDPNPDAYAYSVVRDNCMQSDLALAQAVGANLGARKDWFVDDSVSPSYSHGYIDITGGWRTIMSSEGRCATKGVSCTHIPYWSNPQILYLDGRLMGVDNENVSCSIGYEPAVDCAANNARKLNERVPFTSNYREVTTPAWTPAQTLLVNDVGSGASGVESYYQQAFNALGMRVDLCSTGVLGVSEPGSLDLSPYKHVIWFTGDFVSEKAGPGYDGEIALSSWLNQGGCFLLSSQNYIKANHGQLTTFMRDYIGVLSVGSNTISTTAVGSGPFTGLGEYNLTIPDEFPQDWVLDNTLQPQPNSMVAFQGSAGDIGLFKSSRSYRTSYLAFPLEMLPADADRQAVLGRFLDTCRFNNLFLPLVQRP